MIFMIDSRDMTLHKDIPKLGIGTWNRDKTEAYQVVYEALGLGYRHIDTAQAYDNEEAVGKALSDFGIKRTDYFLTTKVDPINYGVGCVMPSVETSLKKLQVESVDLLLLHFPSLYDKYEAKNYIQQLLSVKEAGLASQIGVSNFTQHYLDIAVEILGADAIATNQVEIHAYMQNKPIVDYCRSLGISTTAYSPLARGELINDATLKIIAQNHNATTAQVALAFLLAEGHIVIPSSANKKRAQENFLALDITLNEKDISTIRTLEKGLRLVDEEWCPAWDQ